MQPSLANEPPVAAGHYRSWRRCRKCGDVSFQDIKRTILWEKPPLVALPCDHKIKHAEVIIHHRTEH